MRQGCSVFVGNIDFDIDEQKIIEELSAVGKVVNFRLMYDKTTGRSKGYGFCEYESPLIAEAAMKTLKITFNGRPVKINYAENDLPQKAKEVAPKSLQTDSIIAVLDSFDEVNLKEVIEYLKKMAIDQPTHLKDFLDRNPNLILAILHTLLKLDLIDKEKVFELVSSSFDVEKQADQITERICTMTDSDMDGFNDDIKNRIVKLRYILTKKIYN